MGVSSAFHKREEMAIYKESCTVSVSRCGSGCCIHCLPFSIYSFSCSEIQYQRFSFSQLKPSLSPVFVFVLPAIVSFPSLSHRMHTITKTCTRILKKHDGRSPQRKVTKFPSTIKWTDKLVYAICTSAWLVYKLIEEM